MLKIKTGISVSYLGVWLHGKTIKTCIHVPSPVEEKNVCTEVAFSVKFWYLAVLWFWIRIRIKLKGRIRIRIRICIKVVNWIRIRIKVINWMQIRINLQMTSQKMYGI